MVFDYETFYRDIEEHLYYLRRRMKRTDNKYSIADELKELLLYVKSAYDELLISAEIDGSSANSRTEQERK